MQKAHHLKWRQRKKAGLWLIDIVWRLGVNAWLKTNEKCLANKLDDSIGLEDVLYSSFIDEGIDKGLKISVGLHES